MIKLLVKRTAYLFLKMLPVKLRNFLSNQINNINYNYDPEHQALVDKLFGESNALVEQLKYFEAEKILKKALVIAPFDERVVPALGRVSFLNKRAGDEQAKVATESMLKILREMRGEIESNSMYVPGDFWNSVGQHHINLLEAYGLENFKRTVSHHYQNWLMCSREDSQVQELFNKIPEIVSPQPWLNVIEIPDYVGLHQININTIGEKTANTFENPEYALAEFKNRETYRISVGLLWEYVKSQDADNILDQFEESEIGNPIKISRNGKLISSDIAHSVRERNIILKELNLDGNEGLVVGELGAGHGRLAEVFGKSTNYRHFIFDITPTIYVSQWYIKNLFPDEKIFEFRHFDDFEEVREELASCRFAFFTSNQIEKIPNDYFDLFINMNSLAEMQLRQIENFLAHIDRLTTQSFFSRQQFLNYNPVEKVELTKVNYSLPETNWNLILDKVDDIYPEYFNQIWKSV